MTLLTPAGCAYIIRMTSEILLLSLFSPLVSPRPVGAPSASPVPEGFFFASITHLVGSGRPRIRSGYDSGPDLDPQQETTCSQLDGGQEAQFRFSMSEQKV